MNIPSPLEITPSLMAGYRFSDGSLVEVDSSGDYRITNSAGTVIDETVDTSPGEGNGLRFGTTPADYGEIMDNLAAFLSHDAEMFEFSPSGSWGSRYPDGASEIDEDELIFNPRVAAWADANRYELSELASYREEKEL